MARKSQADKTGELFADLDLTVPEVNYKSKRTDIWNAYKALREKFEDIVGRLPAAERKLEQRKREQAVEEARERTTGGIVDEVGRLKVSLSKSLDEVASRLVDRTDALTRLDVAIQAREERLAELHDIELAAGTLAELLDRHESTEADHEARLTARRDEVQSVLTQTVERTRQELEEQRATIEAELAAARETCEQELRERRESFEQELAAAREAREVEAKRHEAEVAERDRRLALKREREAEQYQWTVEKERRERDAAAAQKLAEFERELTERREAFERDAEARESALAARETELRELRKKAESFPLVLDKSIKEAVAKARAEVEQAAAVERRLAEGHARNEASLLQQRIEGLEAKVQEQAERLQTLTGQLDGATTKVQEIALRAIDGAAGKQALSAVREIALEGSRKKESR